MSFCACDDQGPMDFYRKETRTARKKYQCGEEDCKTAICIGTRYIYIVGKSADYDTRRPWTFRMCINCDEAWQRINSIVDNADGEVCQCLGSLHETIQEAFDHGYMEEMKEDEDVRWLAKNKYISEDAFVEDGEDTSNSQGFRDYTDERQLLLVFT